jgi:radical SAM superfamily enzyme YgiQ (UPF0313 family)
MSARLPAGDEPRQRAPDRAAARHRGVFFNPPAKPLEDGEGMGQGLASSRWTSCTTLPFNRAVHPMYGNEGVPAFETVKHSVVLMRGCFGGCSFCSITEHEGRVIQSRSESSVLREMRAVRRQGDFRGTITDLGGPTANMYKLKCKSRRSSRSAASSRACTRASART